MESPYEYHNDILGVQARYLFEGRNASEHSLQLIGERGLQHRIKNDAIRKLRPQSPGFSMLVTWASLPQAWRDALVKKFGAPPEKVRVPLFESKYERDARALAFYSSCETKAGVALTDEAIEEYTVNASVLNTLNKVYTERVGYRKSLRGSTKTAWEATVDECNRVREKFGHTLPSNPTRLRQKLNEYKKNGYKVLIHGGWGNDCARKVDDDIEQLLNCLFAKQEHKPTATEIARQFDGFLSGYIELTNEKTGEVYNPSDYSIKSLSKVTVTNYLAEWRNAIGTQAVRSGDRQKLMQRFKPYASMDQPKMAGSLISIDDRQPPFEYAKGKRLWFYNAIDIGSECFTCWVYGKTKEGIIIDFYRQLVRNYTMWGLSMPAELEGEMSLNSSFLNTFLREGAMFEYVRIEANKARGKRIEAYYRQLRYDLEKKREGWLARPFAISEANEAGPGQVPQIPYEKIVEGCLRDIETWNNMPHSKIKGKTRWEVFLESQNPDVQPTNWRAILPSLGYKTRTSCHVGITNLQYEEYLIGDAEGICTGDKLLHLMDIVEGRELDVYWLDDNVGKVMKALVYLADGDRYICELHPKPRYNRARIEQKDADKKALELMSRYTATIDGYMSRQKKKLERIHIEDKRPVTPNRKFQISELKPMPIPTAEHKVEMMPALEEFENERCEVSYSRSLKDRF